MLLLSCDNLLERLLLLVVIGVVMRVEVLEDLRLGQAVLVYKLKLIIFIGGLRLLYCKASRHLCMQKSSGLMLLTSVLLKFNKERENSITS